MREDEVYVGAKSWLRRHGWHVVAGQPPRGTDHLPVVEIKDPLRSARGSEGAYKPDLVAWKAPYLLLIEAKPLLDAADVLKLQLILSDEGRVRELWEELEGRGLTRLMATKQRVRLIGAVAHGGQPAQLPDIGVLVVQDQFGGIALPALAWTEDAFNMPEALPESVRWS